MKRVLLMLGAVSLVAQEPGFRAQSRLVLVPVTVTDSNGHPVHELDPADFQVLDNGRKQSANVDTFASGVAPIALVVAVQAAGVSWPVLLKVQKVGAMIQPLITGERGCAAVVMFSAQINWLQECTSDTDAIARAFEKVRPGEEKSARMLDAAHAAIERLRQRPNARRVLLLISESRDRGSESQLEAVMLAAQSAGVTVYAATYSAFKTAWTTKSSDTPPSPGLDKFLGIGELVRLGKKNTTQELTNATGGTTFSFARQKGLEDAIEKLGTELHTQYVLSFAPEHAEAGYHRLEVRVPRLGDLRLRARPGYWVGASGL